MSITILPSVLLRGALPIRPGTLVMFQISLTSEYSDARNICMCLLTKWCKLDVKATEVMFVRYEPGSKGYQLWDKNTCSVYHCQDNDPLDSEQLNC
jgi:hypothetical protein